MKSGSADGAFVQRVWWGVAAIYASFRPCLPCALVAVAAATIFWSVAQGTEVLRVAGEGSAVDRNYDTHRITIFFLSLLYWALTSWYSTRTLLSLESARVDASSTAESICNWMRIHLPRFLGVVTFWIVGVGFFHAAASYPPQAAPRRSLLLYGFFSFGLGILFWFFVVARRQFIGTKHATLKSVRNWPSGTLLGVGLLIVISLCLLLSATVAPVGMAHNLGMGTILLLSWASWTGVGGLIVLASLQLRLPLAKFLLLLVVLASPWNDNHPIRQSHRANAKRGDVIESFKAWYEKAKQHDPTGPPHACYVVAAEGGGVRAAYWTATVLGTLQDRNPQFREHLFAISGVSGGSLGAAVFEALLAEPPTSSIAANSQQILGQDFLSPALAALLYPDLLQRFIPYPISYFDRSRALEMAWEKAWHQVTGNDRFAEPFMNLWTTESSSWMPSLFLNGTSVENGNRIIVSNLRITANFLDADDLTEKLYVSEHSAGNHVPCIPLSTAAHISARFTFVSPAGSLPDGTHVVDGGYFENAGATTAEEIVSRIKAYCTVEAISDVDVKVILISNNPRAPTIISETPTLESGMKLSDSTLQRGAFLGEVTAPLWAILNTRDAHGTHAQMAIAREQRLWKAQKEASKTSFKALAGATDIRKPSPDIIYFRLADRSVPLPLGWMLSASAAEEIRSQTDLNQGEVRNGEAIAAIIDSLRYKKSTQ